MTPDRALAPLMCAVLAVACSNQLQNTKPVVVAQMPAAASASISATAAAATGTASATAARPGSPDPGVPRVDPALIKAGYRAVRRQGKLLYCQTQTVTGTKFANTTCMTAEQIHEVNRDTEASQRLLIKPGYSDCLGVSCRN
jgi:hypothetical protein